MTANDVRGPLTPYIAVAHGDIGYLSLRVPDAGRAAAFFAAVLGWRYADAGAGPDRQVVGLAVPHGIRTHDGPPTLVLCFAVGDLDVGLDAVVAAGGVAGIPDDEPYGRVVACRDDQGTDFALYQPSGGVAPAERAPAPVRPGDLRYVTMEVVDSQRARAFYGRVLGWRFAPGRVADGWTVTDVEPMVGLRGGVERAVTSPLYLVGELEPAAERVRSAGGRAGPPEAQPYGRTSECADDQRTRFWLMEPRP